jgi:hypothetical protein
VIVCSVDIGGIVDHHCLEVIVCFVDIGGIVDHHCLEVIVCFVDIGGIVDAELQRGPIRHNGAKKKLKLKHKSSLFTLQTFHYNYY